jgi:hypothetical protein
MLVVAQIVHQLVDTTVTDWVSDSSMSKTAHGKLLKVEKSKNGLCLSLSTGKKVNWRMPESLADEVLNDLRACVNPVDEIGVEEVYQEPAFTEAEEWMLKGNW